jgi:hypothetical protein
MVDADTQRKAPALDHASGQNSLGGLPFHPEFYNAAVRPRGVTTTPPAWTKKHHKASTADQEFE